MLNLEGRTLANIGKYSTYAFLADEATGRIVSNFASYIFTGEHRRLGLIEIARQLAHDGIHGVGAHINNFIVSLIDENLPRLEIGNYLLDSTVYGPFAERLSDYFGDFVVASETLLARTGANTFLELSGPVQQEAVVAALPLIILPLIGYGLIYAANKLYENKEEIKSGIETFARKSLGTLFGATGVYLALEPMFNTMSLFYQNPSIYFNSATLIHQMTDAFKIGEGIVGPEAMSNINSIELLGVGAVAAMILYAATHPRPIINGVKSTYKRASEFVISAYDNSP